MQLQSSTRKFVNEQPHKIYSGDQVYFVTGSDTNNSFVGYVVKDTFDTPDKWVIVKPKKVKHATKVIQPIIVRSAYGKRY